MTDFLLELRSEEIPARMQDKAREDLARLFAGELARAGLAVGEIVTYATPRRLALIARDLPAATEAVTEEVKGPKTAAPPQALEGFLRKTGLARAALTERDGVFFAVSEKPGRATATVLAEAIPAIVRGFPWPKSMRWGADSASTESLRWVRPLHGIVALFGEEIVAVEIAGIASGATTYGHRFHHPGAITIGSAADYVDKLRACHVVVDQTERRALIRTRAAALAAEAGLELVEDEGLVGENAGLTEWPVPLLGRFDADFLSVPPEVIQLTARVNQKYFVCRGTDGALANAFVCTANVEASDGGAKIVEGNRKVLAARLADARFFYDTDLKVPLAEQVAKLDKIVFHEQLGTVADKVARVAALAKWLVEAGVVKPLPVRGGVGVEKAAQERSPDSLTFNLSPEGEGLEEVAALAGRAAHLAKADLVTGMVGEFPELQGVMGGYYAAAQGEDSAVADAIRDHYRPVGQGDAVPDAPVTVAVSLADKLDTLMAFFSIDEAPTGSKDPFALRRAALGLLALVTKHDLRLPIGTMIEQAGGAVIRQHGQRVASRAAAQDMAAATRIGAEPDFILTGDYERRVAFEGEGGEIVKLMEAGLPKFAPFLLDRLKVQQREAGVRHDLIDAVFAAKNPDGESEDDLVRLLARVRALQAFMATEDGANLLAGYKRAANILRKEGFEGGADDPLSYTPEPAEAALHAALDRAEPAAARSVAAEEFKAAMAALASLRAPIDGFFDAVTVNDADPARRLARLALLARVRAAVHSVAEFARIEG